VIYIGDPVLVIDAEFGGHRTGRNFLESANLNRILHSRATPPLSAEFVFHLFLNGRSCDAIVGDLEERYAHIHTKFGQRRANFWYWTQAARSVGPIVWAASRVAFKRLSGLAALVELYRRIRP